MSFVSHKKAQKAQKKIDKISAGVQKHFLCFLCLFVAKAFVA